jgi:hypothetical protein
MERLMPDVVKYYDREVTQLIADKYGFTPMEALRSFLSSETHAMLEDKTCGMTDFGPYGIFDIWEAERVTGNPRNSVYIRAE